MSRTCELCSAPTGTILCDPCYAARLRGLLASPAWLEVRGVARGDKPGETMADTIRRYLKNVE